MRVATVGHVEWVTFVDVDHVPRAGEIIHARAAWAEPAGGGAVAAVQMARLAGRAALFTAVGSDAVGAAISPALAALGVDVHARVQQGPQPQAFTHLDGQHERTITVFNRGGRPRGDEALPWDELAGAQAVYFASGDAAALRKARAARVLVATARVLDVLAEAGVPLDVVVHSAADPGEALVPGRLKHPPAVVVSTEGGAGGRFRLAGGREGRYPAAPLPGALRDSYGAGDSFAAGLAFGLGTGLTLEDALALAARCGAEALCRAGAYGGPGDRET
jgi:ribokinase